MLTTVQPGDIFPFDTDCPPGVPRMHIKNLMYSLYEAISYLKYYPLTEVVGDMIKTTILSRNQVVALFHMLIFCQEIGAWATFITGDIVNSYFVNVTKRPRLPLFQAGEPKLGKIPHFDQKIKVVTNEQSPQFNMLKEVNAARLFWIEGGLIELRNQETGFSNAGISILSEAWEIFQQRFYC